MAEIVLFHHAQGLTEGVVQFADGLREAGHIVHTPDLYEGATFGDLEAGVAHAQQQVGIERIVSRGAAAVASLPPRLVYAGISLGNMPAQLLLHRRPGASGALLLHGALPPDAFGLPWPAGVPGQIHTREADPWGDADEAKALAEAVPSVGLFLYPGETHLFTDASLPDHDADAAALVLERALDFLAPL